LIFVIAIGGIILGNCDPHAKGLRVVGVFHHHVPLLLAFNPPSASFSLPLNIPFVANVLLE